MRNIMHNTLNGVNVDLLRETIDVVKKDPEKAIFKFRAKTKWMEAGRSKTEIKDFYGVKQENKSRAKAFIIEGDEPEVLLGNDIAPNAVEMILHALGSCLTVGFVYNASVIGININSLLFDLEGEMDLHSFLGLTDEVRPGYKMINVKIKIDSDGTKEQIHELMEHVKRTSPVLDMLSNSVPVKIQIA
jgi:uncharacterized OsmC-like protein